MIKLKKQNLELESKAEQSGCRIKQSISASLFNKFSEPSTDNHLFGLNLVAQRQDTLGLDKFSLSEVAFGYFFYHSIWERIEKELMNCLYSISGKRKFSRVKSVSQTAIS